LRQEIENLTHPFVHRALHRQLVKHADRLVDKPATKRTLTDRVVFIEIPLLAENHGAGVWAPSPSLTADAAMRLLQDEGARKGMAAAARTLARPHAAEAVAEGLWEMLPT